MSGGSIVWFRQDLRLGDNPALAAAVARGGPIIPVYIESFAEEAPWHPGAASRWWLHRSLRALDASLRERGSRLVLRRGAAQEVLMRLAGETGASEIFWNRRYEPAVVARDSAIKEGFQRQGVGVRSFNGSLLAEPWTVETKSGGPFQVFTPFWRACLGSAEPGDPLPCPKVLEVPESWPGSLDLEELGLDPDKPWAAGFDPIWEPGEAGAARRLRGFLKAGLDRYGDHRNLPGEEGTSRLSPHLHWGEIGPRQVWHSIASRARGLGRDWAAERVQPFMTELGWREFAHHLLYHFPETPTRPLRRAFEGFPWREEVDWLRAWQRGRTGYPLVDAGMRELWATGWMHNRVRMVAASFLVKHLLLHWSHGVKWFWETLVDADLAGNTLGWQWTAGCGADAAPYFRIFNPVAQGERFDGSGDYIRRWVPELSQLPGEWIHQPWAAPDRILKAAGLGGARVYPKPIVEHGLARNTALDAYQSAMARAKIAD